MPKVPRGQLRFVEPDRACGSLAHFCAVSGGQQRRGQPEQLGCFHTPGQFDAVDNVAPLVGPAHLQAATEAERQFAKVIGLQNHVVEFKEGEWLFALKPQLDRIEGQHPVDGEVRANSAQHFDIAERAQPLVVINHHCVGRSVAEGQQSLEHHADRGDVRLNIIAGEHLAALVLAGRIADFGGAAAHHDDWLMPGLLQPSQHHNLHQRANMQRWRGGIEANIARHDLPRSQGIKA